MAETLAELEREIRTLLKHGAISRSVARRLYADYRQYLSCNRKTVSVKPKSSSNVKHELLDIAMAERWSEKRMKQALDSLVRKGMNPATAKRIAARYRHWINDQ